MKLVLLLALSVFSFPFLNAQKNQVGDLPPGRYETVVKQTSWSRGDIILLDNSRYKISTNEEVGEYKFSATAQRLFFISGPLKTVYAKTTLKGSAPTIVLPLAENQGLGLASADIWATLKEKR